MLGYGENLKSSSVSFASSGDNTVISAPTNGYLAIDLLSIVPSSAVTLTLKAGSRSLSGAYSLTANQGFTLDNTFQNTDGVITCLPGEAFVINLGSAVQVSGMVRYRVIGE